MKPSQMEVSPSAYTMIQAFNEWLEDSTKVEYRFSLEEQLYLQDMISMLDAQVDMLVKYELEKRKDN